MSIDFTPQPNTAHRLRVLFHTGVIESLPSATRTVLTLLRIMAPVSFAVFLLKHAGGLNLLARGLAPVFSLFGMPGASALVFITGALLNIYAAIGVMDALGLSNRTMTILALMVLTAHNLPVECAVQRRTGSDPWRLLALRLSGAFFAAAALNALLPPDIPAAAPLEAMPAAASFLDDLGAWIIGFTRLSLRMTAIIVGLLIVQRLLDRLGIIRALTNPLRYPLRILGVPDEAAFLWIVANTLGLAYGAGVLIAHADEGRISREHADRLNHYIALSHSLLEDTILFASVGVPVFWITVPRLILGAIGARLRPLRD